MGVAEMLNLLRSGMNAPMTRRLVIEFGITALQVWRKRYPVRTRHGRRAP